MDGYPQRDTISECLPRWIPSYVCWIILKLYRSYTMLILSYKCVYALSRLQKYLNIQCSIISIKPSIQWPECPFLKFIIIYCKSYFPNTSSQSCTKNSHWFSRNLLGKILRIYVVSEELFTPHILLTQSLILILLSTSTVSFHLPVSWFSARLFLRNNQSRGIPTANWISLPSHDCPSSNNHVEKSRADSSMRSASIFEISKERGGRK